MANGKTGQGSRQEYWRAAVDRYDRRAEGVTLEEFCRREDVNASTMFLWRRRFQTEAENVESFVRVHLAEPESVDEGVEDEGVVDGGVEIVTPDGFTIRLTSREELGETMRILRDASC
jgi:transposase-like protein